MKIIELLIDELDKLSGVDAVALVEQPAIEADFFAFNEVDIEDVIEFELIKNAMEDLQIGELSNHVTESYADNDLHFNVTVVETENGKKYMLNGELMPDIHLMTGCTYCFEQSDESNEGHPLRISTTKNGTHDGGEEYTNGVAVMGDKLYLQVTEDTPQDLFYYCVNHSGMAGDSKIIINHVHEFESYTDYPESATNAAKRALKWREEHTDNDCGTRVGWARANQLANRRPISEETIARMASFARHLQHEDVPYSEGCGGLMVDAWGGRAGIEWAKNKLESIREENSAETQAFSGKTGKFTFALEEDQQIVVGPLMIPDKLILRVDEDNNPYYVFFSEDTVKKIAYKLMKQKNLDALNIEHDPNNLVEGHMLETWLVEDPAKDKQQVYGFNFPKGTWMGQYKVEDLSTWNKIKEGNIKGFSIEGFFQDKFIQASKTI